MPNRKIKEPEEIVEATKVMKLAMAHLLVDTAALAITQEYGFTIERSQELLMHAVSIIEQYR